MQSSGAPVVSKRVVAGVRAWRVLMVVMFTWAALAAQTASAAVVSIATGGGGSGLRVNALSDAGVNKITVESSGAGTWTVTDSAIAPTAGSGCGASPPPGTGVTCTASLVDMVVWLGPGNDTFQVGTVGSTSLTNAFYYGGAGADSINGASWADFLHGDDSGGPYSSDYLNGAGGNDTIYGENSGVTAGAGDTLTGGTGSDVLYGQGGDDTFNAVDGAADSLYCGTGIDGGQSDPLDSRASDCESVTYGSPPAAPTITAKPANPTNSTSASFSFTGEPGATFECKVGTLPPPSSSFTSCTSPTSYTGLGNGSHTFEVRQTTAAGGTGPAASYTWTVDTVAPAAPTISSKPSNPSSSTSASFSFTGESGGSFECKLDTAAFAACTSPKAYSGLADGSHTFQVRQIDAAGNVGSAASYTWTVDATPPPAPTISSKPNAVSTTRDATFSFFSEAGATYECTLNGDSSPCKSPVKYTDLDNGVYTFEVSATDAGGKTSPTSSYTWTVVVASLGGGYPANVTAFYQLQTIYGTCDVSIKANTLRATGGLYGQVSGSQSADCWGLSVAPGTFSASTEISGIDLAGPLDNGTVAPPTGSPSNCSGKNSCSSSQSRTPLVVGNYRVRHHLALDISSGSGGGTYFTSYPPECDIHNADSGRIICDVDLNVTL